MDGSWAGDVVGGGSMMTAGVWIPVSLGNAASPVSTAVSCFRAVTWLSDRGVG